ncbi:MAG: response regulator, partial [Leptospiraceae bacterium]|nr:response regulator [Leptospiraceae bacterium]
KPEDTASHQALDGEKQTRILIVDDNRDIILNIGSILKRKGFLVSTCDNGQTALGLISSSPDKYNIIITDELMPGMSGSELIPKIQKITPSINIICWSGYFDKEKEDSEKIKYLQKPVSKEKLLNILEGFAEKK